LDRVNLFICLVYSNQIKNYQSGCDSGDAKACINLGEAYRKGKDVKRDYAKALSLYKKACDLGDGLGCNNSANVYRIGLRSFKKFTIKLWSFIKKPVN